MQFGLLAKLTAHRFRQPDGDHLAAPPRDRHRETATARANVNDYVIRPDNLQDGGDRWIGPLVGGFRPESLCESTPEVAVWLVCPYALRPRLSVPSR